MSDVIWSLERGRGPVVATAIHDGHDLRPELLQYLALEESSRLREEDPHTGRWTSVAPTRVVGLRSRFEVDLNRPREKAVYRVPEDAWGLRVWKEDLPEAVIHRSLGAYDRFYEGLRELYGRIADQHGRFLVLDLHTYNHRRDGPDDPPADAAGNPQVNVGTGTMVHPGRWTPLVRRLMEDLASFDFPGGPLDVRENVRFRGGECAAWTHRTFPDAACVLSIEVKKFFMDEWTGEADEVLVDAVAAALESALPGAVEELGRS